MDRKLADNLPVFVWSSDRNFNFTYVNNYWSKFCGTKKSKIIGKGWLDFAHKKDLSGLKRRLNEYKEVSHNFSFKIRMRHCSGKYKWIKIVGVRTKESTKDHKFAGVGYDINSLVVSDDRKREFMSFASHELKTPLTALSVYIDIIQKRTKSKNYKEALVFIRKAKKNVSTLTNLIGNFLDITRSTKGDMQLILKNEDISKIVKSVYEESLYLHRDHKIVLEKVESKKISLDKGRVRQVLENIISNGARYSPKSSIIKISQSVGELNVLIRVSDEGIGIPKSEQKRIFNENYQLENNPYKVVGMGMGLYIAKYIIKNHRGDITVHSKLGEGFVFTIKLPLERSLT